MEIETAANPADVADTHAVEDAPVTLEGAQPQAEGTQSEPTEPEARDPNDMSDLLPPEDEFVEVEIDGKKIKVSADGKDYLLRQSDYTRKTMEAAEQSRQAKADRARYQQLANLTAAETRAAIRLEGLHSELAEFEKIPWASLDHSDPDVVHAKGRRDELAREAANLRSALNEHLTQKTQQEQQDSAKFRAETDAEAAKIIKDWTPEKRQTLETFAVENGIPAENAGQASAAEFKLLNLAHIGHQFIERQRAAARAQAASTATPAPEVSGGASGAIGDPQGMSMAEYVAARKAGKI